ncbi:MAG: flagellar hook protein, partial [Lachnospiraceae bacterium]|nr:flagellar hook protein [Lachnospiraceae bacterium]
MVRITGMNSGLDTETIITELASARSVKVQSMQKKQTKLSWKMDAWKELNSKVYKFYTSTLDNMRFASGYSKKTTTVSDSSVASVVTGGNAMSGTQTLKVKQLAQSAYMTGGKIMRAESDGTYKKADATGNTIMGDLGVQDDFSLKVKVNGEEKELKFHADATIDDIVAKIKGCGVNANFDEKNGRIFIGASKTGGEYDFTISAGEGEASTKVLTALGLNTEATGDQKAQKIDGKDAIIELNGATFSS